MDADTEHQYNDAGEHCAEKVLSSTMYGSSVGEY